jgi:hypothetical protein
MVSLGLFRHRKASVSSVISADEKQIEQHLKRKKLPWNRKAGCIPLLKVDGTCLARFLCNHGEKKAP